MVQETNTVSSEDVIKLFLDNYEEEVQEYDFHLESYQEDISNVVKFIMRNRFSFKGEVELRQKLVDKVIEDFMTKTGRRVPMFYLDILGDFILLDELAQYTIRDDNGKRLK